jgi:hypothetical protein
VVLTTVGRRTPLGKLGIPRSLSTPSLLADVDSEPTKQAAYG